MTLSNYQLPVETIKATINIYGDVSVEYTVPDLRQPKIAVHFVRCLSTIRPGCDDFLSKELLEPSVARANVHVISRH